MPGAWIFSAAFVLAYIYISTAGRLRGPAVWCAAALASAACAIAGDAPDLAALMGRVDVNILLIFSGIMLIAEVLIETRAPAWAAERIVSVSGTLGRASLLICALAGAVSMFVENVATVMILAPVALALSRRLEADPVPLLIGIAISSNLQGTATLVGDPPSMILAASEGLSFNDFFVLDGMPGIFFAVQCGAVASFFVLWRVFGRSRRAVAWSGESGVSSWVPVVILAIVIAGLALTGFTGPSGPVSGLVCAAGGLAALIWHTLSHRGVLPGIFRARKATDLEEVRGSRQIVRGFDLDTVILLAGIFFMVGALEEYGVVDAIGRFIAGLSGGSAFGAFALIVLSSVVVSAFVDNVPFVTAMLPVVHSVASDLGIADWRFLSFGMLIGACLGGNISPVGASANIVAVSMLRKEGYRVSFGRFAALGLPFTLAATAAGAAFIWFVWGP